MTKVLLASGSARRAQLLSQIGVQFDVVVPNIDETRLSDEPPLEYVQRMSLEKANAIDVADQWVLSADTTVACEGAVLEKPRDYDDAFCMLSHLSGKVQQVYTAVTLLNGAQLLQCYSCTDVKFRELTTPEIERYLATSEYIDKAGGYGIQGMGAALVESFSGSYTGVVGLPLEPLITLFQQAKIDYWNLDD